MGLNVGGIGPCAQGTSGVLTQGARGGWLPASSAAQVGGKGGRGCNPAAAACSPARPGPHPHPEPGDLPVSLPGNTKLRFKVTGFAPEMNNLLLAGVTFGSPSGLTVRSTVSPTLKPRMFLVPHGSPQMGSSDSQEPPGAPCCPRAAQPCLAGGYCPRWGSGALSTDHAARRRRGSHDHGAVCTTRGGRWHQGRAEDTGHPTGGG